LKNTKTTQTKILKNIMFKWSLIFYAVGTFGGWAESGHFMLKIEDVEPCYHIKDTHYIITPIEHVFEKKQEGMRQLHCGIE